MITISKNHQEKQSIINVPQYCIAEATVSG